MCDNTRAGFSVFGFKVSSFPRSLIQALDLGLMSAPQIAGPSGLDIDAQPTTSQLYESVARLSIDHLEWLQECCGFNDKNEIGSLSDAELAVQLAVEEARAYAIFIEDRALVEKLQREEADDIDDDRAASPAK